MGHHNPILSVGHAQMQFVPPYPHGTRELISVPGCHTSTYYFVDEPYGLRHGSGSRPRLLGQYFKDSGEGLRCGTVD